jgi:hypothetical protein
MASQGTPDWVRPPSMVARATAIAFARIFIGLMWLFEITVGHNWKIGTFGSGANPGWIGNRAGQSVSENAQTAITDGTWAVPAWFFESLIIPNAEVAGYLVIALQVALVFAFILGIGVRPMALAALVMDFTIFMLGNSRIPPFFTMAHIFLLVSGAGMYYGLDGVILAKTRGTTSGVLRLVRWGITLPVFKRSYLAPATAVAAFIALFFFLTIPTRETTRMANVGLDLAAIFGLVALGLYAASRLPDRLAVLAGGLRIFIGFKFLHEIWTRTEPGTNALPGFASADAQSEVFASVVANHWAPIASFIEGVVLPNMQLWVVAFGAVQLAVGIMLLVGYRTRLAGVVGLLFLGTMIALGLTRYAPFLFGLLIPVLALDGGRFLSLDSIRAPSREARYGLPIPVKAVPALIALAAASALLAGGTAIAMGIEPDAYVGSMRSMTAAFAAIFFGLLALGGWLQRHPRLDYSEEPVEVPELLPQPAG